ncbi:hypothetical protein JCM12296A_53330 [Desulfosarcina cetonica]
MNAYGLISITIFIVVLSHVFQIQENMNLFFSRILDIPSFTSFTSHEPIFTFCIRIVYLIALVAVVKLFVSRDK